jgi:large subunit ribosomal protein L37Ae
LGPLDPGSNPGSPILLSIKNKMPSKLKKTKSAGRFGARYGRSVRAKLVNVEQKQRLKQKCPYCEKMGVKRLSKGIWECSKCGKKFASDIYYLKN